MNKYTYLKVGLASLICFSATDVYASAFQLFEQNGAGVGDIHAGGAAEASDASTGFYNPAGLVRLKNQQIVVGGVLIDTGIKYNGSINTSQGGNSMFSDTGSANGGNASFVPNLHYAAPLSDRVVVGFNLTVPFGLKTEYPDNSLVRYAATKTSVETLNISPSIGFALNKQLSFGAGFDAEHMQAEFDSIAGLGPTNLADTRSVSKASDWAYGFHLGVLYQVDDHTRFGLAYQSSIDHHLTGTSNLNGPLVGVFGSGTSYTTNNAYSDFSLPATATLSAYHDINEKWAILGGVNYTHWSTVKNLSMKNVAGIDQNLQIAAIDVIVPQHFKNTFSVNLGAHYVPCEKWMLRTGLIYDISPVTDTWRNLRLPDGNRFGLGLGAHYQVTPKVGLDLGWHHLFLHETKLNVSQPTGPLVTTTRGTVNSRGDIVGAQATFDIA